MNIFGREYTSEELKKWIGDISQIAGIKSYTLNEGKAKGVNALDIRTGSGLNFTVLPDRSMDIVWMDYKGLPIGYITKAGIVNPQYYQSNGYEWLRSFYGGVLTTCGLTHVGPPEKEGIWELGLHGRIANIPAFEVNHSTDWESNDLVFTIKGKMREAVLYEENLVLSRKIIARGGENKVTVFDEIENQGYEDTPCMILYHMNMGFPLVSEQSQLIAPIMKTDARDEDAVKGIDRFASFEAPTKGYVSQVFFHKPISDEDGTTCVGIVNELMSFGLYIRYNCKELPFLTQWKMMGCQDYVVGLEPGNCKPIGRNATRERGELEILKAGEKKLIKLELVVLSSHDEIQEYKSYISGVMNTSLASG